MGGSPSPTLTLDVCLPVVWIFIMGGKNLSITHVHGHVRESVLTVDRNLCTHSDRDYFLLWDMVATKPDMRILT